MKYLEKTRSLAVSLVLILPLLIAYEAWLVISRPTVVNSAGQLLRLPFRYLSDILNNVGHMSFLSAAVLFNGLLILVFLCAVFWARKREEFRLSLFVPVSMEGLGYGLLMGTLSLWILRVLPANSQKQLLAIPEMPPERFEHIMLSVGAGVYEEIIFRLLLVGGLFLVGIMVFERKRLGVAIAILVAGSIVCAFIEQLSVDPSTFSWQGFVKSMMLRAPVLLGYGVLLLSVHCGIIWLMMKFLLSPSMASACVSIVIGSILFSYFHHTGNMAEPFDTRVFCFRFVAGVLLATLYQVRGLGVAVYTHAFYDILVALKETSGTA